MVESFLSDSVLWQNDDEEMATEFSIARLKELGLKLGTEKGAKNDAILVLWAESKLHELREECAQARNQEKKIMKTIEHLRMEINELKGWFKK